MITAILQHLDQLQLDLATIDPAHDLDAADKVASLASALRHSLRDLASPAEKGAERPPVGLRHEAA